MRKVKSLLLVCIVSLLMVVLVACGGEETVEPTPEPVVQEESPTTQQEPQVEEQVVVPETTGAVASLEDVQNAVVQIVSQGSFMDPEVGMQMNAAGSGSGFIVDPSGIAVTNNHVVTGAAFIEVFIAGEDKPRNAQVLGVSECSDLAVIDIEGDDLPYMEWHSDDVNVGLDIYTAGFPLGDPEFTLTRGIVSKAQANGDTNWASVEHVLEHDATINPGNSGGPLVSPTGQIVGVNYAGNSNTNQYFAIGQEAALSVIEELRGGNDVHSIGVNGTAVNNGEGLSGIWVSSVESGTPADAVGVQAGDIILSMEGLVLATDGTMADYCNILRSRQPSDILSIEVLRFETQEVLEGQLNGDPLAQTVSFAQEVGSEVAASSESYQYTYIEDDSGLLTVEVPTAWAQVDGSPWMSNGESIGVRLNAATDLDGFWGNWSTPGVVFGASAELVELVDEDGMLDEFDYSDSCTYDGRYDYSDALYSGKYDLWTNCGNGDSIYLTLAATPENRDFIIYVGIQAVTEADLEALDRILDSFMVDVS
ncbi:MAG: S1C family serine protease [Chloroflexota bacterium]